MAALVAGQDAHLEFEDADREEEDAVKEKQVDETEALPEIELQVGDTTVTSCSWSELAAVASTLTIENFEKDCPVHKAVAFEQFPDSDEFCLPLFVVRCPDVSHSLSGTSSSMIFIFDKQGRQHARKTMADFLKDWREDCSGDDGHGGLSLMLRGGPLGSVPSSEEALAEKLEEKAQAIAPIRGRVRMAYGSGTEADPLHWYGGTVDHINEDGARVIACDDGCVETYTLKDIERSLQAGGFEALDASAGGVYKNQTGRPKAECFAWAKFGREKKGKIVGVLIGADDFIGGGTQLYQSFVVNKDAFTLDEQEEGETNVSTRAREKEQENLASKQDQLGLHTFRRGDKVVYKSNPKAIAFVSALSFPKTGPKYLVLQEEASSLFFIGGYTESSHS